MTDSNSNSSNFSERLTKETALVYDFRATIDGEDRFFIIKVSPTKRKAFLKAVKDNATFQLEDFGEILHRGWGEPTDDLKQHLQEKYGMYADEIFYD
ncbi:MAG: hypothetical protein R3D71_07825 [Rickettsiales bacterium]